MGINYHGFFKDISGIAEAARLNVLALKSAGIQISFNNYYAEKGIRKDDEIHEFNTLENNHDINIFHINLNALNDFFKTNSVNILDNKYNIAYWAWEFKEIPEELLPYLLVFDEIWVPSNFCVETFANIAPIPIIRFLHPIQASKTNDYSKENLKIPLDTYNFLMIMDPISTSERKNPFGAIDAFQSAFNSNETNVKLIIKTFKLDRNKRLNKKLKEVLLNFKNIILIDEDYSKSKMEALIQNCDALISLHRAEGFGLTMAEAMGHGKPVVATGYSGNIDFMTINNSYLIQYKLTTLKEDCGILKSGFVMSEPDLDHATSVLKYIIENKEIASKKGLRAKKDIEELLAIDKIGLQMKNRLELISKHFLNLDADKKMDEIQNIFLENSILKQRNNYLENTIYCKIRKKINAFFKKNRK